MTIPLVAATRQVRLASEAVGTFLHRNKELLQQAAPSLIISSSPLDGSHRVKQIFNNNKNNKNCNVEKYNQALDRQIQKCQFSIRLKHNIRTVSFRQTAAYPTVSDLRQAFDLYSRSGCNHILAVGSGAAIDLAKGLHACLAHSRPNNSSRLILIPSTPGAVLASTAQETLVFCPGEDALLPIQIALSLEDGKQLTQPHCHDTKLHEEELETILIDSEFKNSSIVIPMTAQQYSASIYEAAFAALAITLDAALRHIPNDAKDSKETIHTSTSINTLASIETTFQYITQGLQNLTLKQDVRHIDPSTANHNHSTDVCLLQAQQDIIQALIHAGSLLTFYPTSIPIQRSLPYTLSCALLPPFFPHGNWLSFISSLLPGILSLSHNQPISSTLSKDRMYPYNFRYYNHLIQEIERCNLPIYELWTHYSRTMSSLAEGTPTYDTLLDKVDAHQALLGYGYDQDVDLNLYRQILIQSLNK